MRGKHKKTANNGAGQRLSVTVWQSGASITSRYVVDSARQGAVLAATANSQTTFYLYGLGVIAEQTSIWAYYLKDGQNTVRQMTDGAAVVTLARTYDPFGQVLAQAGSGNLTWGYWGGLLDAATGLVYVGNRQYYDPVTGRFLSPSGRGRNLYVPTSRGDPLGAALGPVALIALGLAEKLFFHFARASTWLDSVVPARQDAMPFQVDLRFLFSRDLETSFIIGGIQVGPTPQACFRSRRPNEFEDGLVTAQRLPGPVLFDMAKQLVFNRVPFGRVRRQVYDGDCQAELVRQLLEPVFPQPATVAIRSTTVRFDQQMLLASVNFAPHFDPPPANGSHGELWGLVRCAHHHKAFIPCHRLFGIGPVLPIFVGVAT